MSIKTGFNHAVALAGLEDVHPHDLRRTCGSWLAQAGVPIHAISALLRHADIRITDQVYAHHSAMETKAAVDVLAKESRNEVSRSSFTLQEGA